MKHRSFVPFAVLYLVVAAVGAAEVELPQMKPGLWEIRMQRASGGKADAKPATLQQCKDASEMAHAKATSADYAKKNCSKNETRREGGKWVNDTVCKVGARTMSTHSVSEASSDTAYHMEITSTFDPPAPGHLPSTTTIDGKWMGTCKSN
jgi:hypothetical protein